MLGVLFLLFGIVCLVFFVFVMLGAIRGAAPPDGGGVVVAALPQVCDIILRFRIMSVMLNVYIVISIG